MNDYIERGNYYEFGGKRWVLAEDFTRLLAELNDVNVIRGREAELDSYRCKLIEEQEREIERLRAEVERLTTELEDLQLRHDRLHRWKWHQVSGAVVIQAEQIDKAWACPSLHEALEFMGIVECPVCGGAGVTEHDAGIEFGDVTLQCLSCHGHGWIREERVDE